MVEEVLLSELKLTLPVVVELVSGVGNSLLLSVLTVRLRLGVETGRLDWTDLLSLEKVTLRLGVVVTSVRLTLGVVIVRLGCVIETLTPDVVKVRLGFEIELLMLGVVTTTVGSVITFDVVLTEVVTTGVVDLLVVFTGVDTGVVRTDLDLVERVRARVVDFVVVMELDFGVVLAGVVEILGVVATFEVLVCGIDFVREFGKVLPLQVLAFKSQAPRTQHESSI